ncbi:MAG: transposase [Acidobacteria bacterium]|nr:transposase [Acidobacteriota bacterium]
MFTQTRACEIFLEALLYYRSQGAYELHAFVLMPDHFHVLMTPSSAKSLERVVQYIKGGSARRIGDELQMRFPVWQRGFSDHRIRDSEDDGIHVHYIEQNPVRRALVGVAPEYPWSSASGRFELDEVPQGLRPRSA